jgi:hypothetical protein
MTSKVYVLIVNWNNWPDTLECLESVFRSGYPRFQVILCDNGSTDGSLHHVKAWAEGRLDAPAATASPLRGRSSASLPRPIRYLERDKQIAETGGGADDGECPLILIQTGQNAGFGAGNNVGLRYALARDDAQFVWLLNNDTVVAPDALTELVATLEADADAGQCGSTILFYDRPEIVQLCGGCEYNSWWGSIRALGAGRLLSDLPEADRVRRKMTYVGGASLLARMSFVKQVGLLAEDYFLYFEEIDWATRGKGQYGLAYAPRSRVYHKEGKTAGSSSQPMSRATPADLFLIRSRIVYTRKFKLWAIPTVCLAVAGMLLNRLRRGQWERVIPMARVAARSLVEELAAPGRPVPARQFSDLGLPTSR